MTEETSIPTEMCERHPERRTTGACGRCGGPICRECVEEFGYYCSVECREASKSAVTPEERRAAEEAKQTLEKAARHGRILVAVLLALLAGGVFWVLWKFFLDPAGKVCWRWEQSIDRAKLAILGSDADRVWVRAGDRLVALALKNGKELSSLQVEALDQGFDRIETVDGGVLLLGAEKITRLNYDGTVVCSFELLGRSAELALSPDGSRAFAFLLPPTVFRLDQPDAQQTKRLACFSLTDGTEIWQETRLAKSDVARMTADADRLFVLFSRMTEQYRLSYILCVFDADSGGRIWSVALPEAPGWGPEVWSDTVLFQVEDEIFAYPAAGADEPLWSVSVPESFGSAVVKEGLLFCRMSGGTECFDAQTGASLWKTDMRIGGADAIILGANRVFLSGHALVETGEAEGAEDGGVKLPPAYEELDGVAKELGVDMASLKQKRTTPTLLCIERRTGKELWRTRNVVGWLRGDGERLVLTMDTSETSMLDMIGGGKGLTIIRQYDTGDGAMLYSRQSELGFTAPHLAGDRLIGVAHERVDQPGLMSGFDLGTAAEAPKIKGLGIVAFQVK